MAKQSTDATFTTLEQLRKELADVLEREKRLREEIAQYESILASGGSESAFRYVGKDIVTAVKLFLSKRRSPLPEHEIVREMILGGATAGKGHPQAQVRRSLSAMVRLGSLKLKKNLYGLPDWPDKEFK